VYWIPISGAADTIMDFAETSEKGQFAANLVHPKPTTWTSIFTAIRDSLAQDGENLLLELIPFEDWLRRVDELPENRAAEVVSHF
jgi:hypothetical protein